MIATRWLCQPLTDTCLYLVLALESWDLSPRTTRRIVEDSSVFLSRVIDRCCVSFLVDGLIYVRTAQLIVSELAFGALERFVERKNSFYNYISVVVRIDQTQSNILLLFICDWSIFTTTITYNYAYVIVEWVQGTYCDVLRFLKEQTC